jgi:hypothetical protein
MAVNLGLLCYFPRMLVRRGVATVAFAGLLSSPALARAQAFTVNPSVTIAGGYSANKIIPHNPLSNPSIRLGPFLSLAPSLALVYETPRTTQSLQATAGVTLPLNPATITVPEGSEAAFSDESFTYNVRLAYSNRIQLSELTTLNLGLAGSAVPVNPTIGGLDAYSAPLEETLNIFAYNFSLNGQESLTRELSPESRVVQLTNVTYTYPFNVDPIRPTTLNVRNSLAVTQDWTRDTGTLTLTIGYTRFGIGEGTTGAVTEATDEFTNSLVATWQRLLTPSLTSSVDFGVLQAVSPQSTVGQIYQPIGGASLAYELAFAAASLSYIHNAAPNIFTATINLNDQVALRAAVPVAATGFGIEGSVGFTHSRPIALNSVAGGGTDSFLADVAVTYSPPPIPKLSASIRGTYDRQTPIDDPLAGFTRLSLIANVAFSFPDAQAAAIQRRVAPAYTPTPVLGSDSTPSPGVQPRPIEIEESEATPLPAAPAKP